METARKATGVQNLAYIAKLDRQYLATRTAKYPIVIGFLVCMAIFALLCLACVPSVSKRLAPGPWRAALMRFLEPASVVVLALPVSFLLVSAFSFHNWWFPMIFCLVYALVVGLGAYYLGRKNQRLNPATLVCLFSFGVMFVDLLFGGRLLIIPLLGSSSQDGMRFFGMSNAVSGMMIAFALWAFAGLGGDYVTRRGPARWGIFLGLAVMAFAVGFGGLGGDFGGFIAATATVLVFFFATTRGGFRAWRIPAIIATIVIATAVIVGADALFVHTHAGHALAAGSGQFFSMIGRKALVLLTQIKSVLFLALLMIAAVMALALWMKRPSSIWRPYWEFDRTWAAALFSILIGSIVALLFNDTGIGMMGTMVMVTVPVTVYHFIHPQNTTSGG
jgi:hypothetical protein